MSSHLGAALEAFRKQQAQKAAEAVQAETQPKKKPRKSTKTTGSGSTGQGRAQAAGAAKGNSHEAGIRQNVSVKGSVSLGKQLKDVLDWLLANREDSLTPAQIQEKFGYVCLEGSQLHKSLLANSKIGVSADGAFTYKAAHKLEDREQLMGFLRKNPEGTHLGQVKDAYPGVAADIARLQKEGKVWGVQSAETGELVLYPREHPPLIKVSADVAALWHEVAIPQDPELLEAELKRAGIVPAPRSGPRRRAPLPPKERAKRKYRPRNVTNVHMPELFMDPAPTQID